MLLTATRLSGKVALVTGASKGIGAAIAKRLAAEGAAIAVNYARDDDAAGRVVAEIRDAGGRAFCTKADISDASALSPLVHQALANFERLDILVNNAAIAEGAQFDEISETFIDRHFATNFKAALLLSQAAARVIRPGGSIVNVSSIGTRAAHPGFMVYSATKAALEMLTISMSRELGPKGVRVNAVAPGQIDTEMLRRNLPAAVLQGNIDRISLGRLGHADDIAKVVAFLASDDSGWITGETIHVSGGQRL